MAQIFAPEVCLSNKLMDQKIIAFQGTILLGELCILGRLVVFRLSPYPFFFVDEVEGKTLKQVEPGPRHLNSS